MAAAVNVFGACTVKVDTGTSSALETLGYSAEGPRFRENAKWLEVPGDQNGGPEGIPIDIQFLGREDAVMLDLTKWDDAVLNKIRGRLKTTAAMAAPGEQATPGTLMAANCFRLLLVSTLYDASTNPNAVRNYLVAIPWEPIELNRGTKYSRCQFGWRCLPNSSNVIWNLTAT